MAVAFVKCLGVFVPAVSEGTVLVQVGRYGVSTAQAVALVVIAALTWLNVSGLCTGAIVQNVFTIAKVAAVAALVVLAIASGKGSAGHFRPLLGAALGPEGIKVGLFAAEEMKEPERVRLLDTPADVTADPSLT